MPIPVVTVAQMQALEDASERAGVSRDALMENAGLAGADYIRRQLGGIAGRRILALIGPGNNGADGLVIARRLAQWGAAAHCHIVSRRPDADPKLAAARAAGVAITDAASDADQSRLAAHLTRCDAVIDAILGAGRYRPPQGAIADAISLVNRHRHFIGQNPGRPVFAIDLPTGVHPDTAAVADPTIIADHTLALGCPKSGIAHFPGAGCAGRIALLDIGLPPSVINRAALTTEWMDASLASTLLPARPPDAHKGAFGHLLIIAGSRHYVGAAALAATAAHRAGAGLVTLATPAGIHPIVAARLTETIHLPLPEDADGRVAPSAAAVIRARIGAYDALAVGCGMGQSPGAVGFMRQLLQDCAGIAADAGSPALPIIIDADGLNNLARVADWPALLHGIPAILTPHPGELATLTGRPVPEIQSDRPDIAADCAARWGQTILLKGAHSIVAGSDSDGGARQRQRILPFANPALAAGGTGDVLTGIIGALLAQGLPPYDAAALGGYLHGTAGEHARRRHGDAGVIASDLPPLLPSIMQDLRTPDWRDDHSD